MAVKIIPMKHNPVSLHSARSFNLSWENVFKRNVEKYHDTKPPKDNKFVMVNSYMYNGRSSTVIDGGTLKRLDLEQILEINIIAF
jgi:hypothetical protein